LRTPLASMKSVIETLRGGAVHNEKAAREFLALADGEVDRLVQMVEELLELSRIESGDVPLTRRPVDLAAALARAVERLRVRAERQGLRLTLQVAPGLPPITGDAERLERVAVNLIQNALNFTPAGGSINVSACREDGAVTVRVRDTGVGIAPEDLPRIFERFYKADRVRGPKDAGLAGGGTGLGLAIVKHTVEAHGGRVSVESRMGEGATFTVTVPLSMPSKAD
jgi:two-component system phosphate regulon sensor histidine kinase PhoR